MIDPDIISEYKLLDEKLWDTMLIAITGGVAEFSSSEPTHGCWRCKKFIRINLSCKACGWSICGGCGACQNANKLGHCDADPIWRKFFALDGAIPFEEIRRLDQLRLRVLLKAPDIWKESKHEQPFRNGQ